MRFIAKNGVLLETTDVDKIAAFRASGCKELEETPNQNNVVVENEYTVNWLGQ